MSCNAILRLDTPAINYGYEGHHSHGSGTVRAQPSGGYQSAAPSPIVSFFSELMSMFTDDSAAGMSGDDDPLKSSAPTAALAAQTKVSIARSARHHHCHYRALNHYHRNSTLFAQNEFCHYLCDETTTSIKLMVTLDPLLATCPPSQLDVTVGMVIPDDRYMVSYAKDWTEHLRTLHPWMEDRDLEIFVSTSTGYRAHVCRYLTPQQPPPGYDTRRACLHLVSLIPFLEDAHAFVGETDLWCTCNQVYELTFLFQCSWSDDIHNASRSQAWEMGAGDEEEHAIVLYNYLLYLERQKRGAAAASVKSGGK